MNYSCLGGKLRSAVWGLVFAGLFPLLVASPTIDIVRGCSEVWVSFLFGIFVLIGRCITVCHIAQLQVASVLEGNSVVSMRRGGCSVQQLVSRM